MGCAGCSVKSKDGTPQGCRSNGSCGTSGCNRLNTFDWLATQEIVDVNPFDLVEVSFKNGSRKGFYINQRHLNAVTGDMVVVEGQTGYDVGRISLSGDLVRLQMKKKRAKQDHVVHKVLRHANQRDLEKLDYARSQEIPTMIRARAIARSLDVDMKVGDVEYQGDNRKATFYYTAEGRIDFRELIRHFAKDFKVKVEMRQIGARQESAKIGGIGSCGRELCCSTWLSDFKSVSTAAARYQNLAINQAKLSGQCGRLKCCLNFELDSYMDALKAFPKNTDRLKTQAGIANLVKTDIFKGIMYFAYHKDGRLGKFYPLEVEQVKKIKAMNAKGDFPLDLMSMQIVEEAPPVELDFESVNDVIELPPEERRRRKGRGRGGNKGGRGGRSNRPDNKRSDKRPDAKKSDDRKPNNRRNDDRKNSPKPDDKKPSNRRGRGRKPAAKEGDKPTTNNPRNKQQQGNKSAGNKSRNRRPQGDKPDNRPTNKSGNEQGNKPTGKPNPQGKGKPRPMNKPANPQANKPTPKPNQSNKPAAKPTPPPVVNKTTNKPAAPKPADKPVVNKADDNAAKLARLNKKRSKSKSNKNRRGGKPKGNDNKGGDAS